jgi:alpha/beta superfamily hydrolase
MSVSPLLPAGPEGYADTGDSPTRESASSGRLEAFLFPGPAGDLEGLWKEAEGGRIGSAVCAHPPPLHGGTLHNKVVFRAARTFARAGYGVLRFNFRGVGLSQGGHDSGRGETDDFRAALDEAERRGGEPLVAGGFSFGSAVGLRAIVGDSRVRAFIGVGVPLASQRDDPPPRPAVPALFVTGSEDVHGPPAPLEEWAAGVGSIVIVPGADHFLEGKLDALEAALGEFLAGLSGRTAP